MKTISQLVRKYYKYSYQTFTQPTLSADGLIGFGNFAISVNKYYRSYYGYLAFDNNASTCWYPDGAFPYDCIMYNPQPLKVTKITITNGIATRVVTEGTVYASNDNLNWVTLKSFTNSVTTANTAWDIDLSNNSTPYNYYKISITNGNATTNGTQVTQIDLTAQTAIVTEGTSSDYVFYKDVNVFTPLKIPKRLYFKYNTQTFTQPILTWNGFLGSDNFAVSASSVDGTRDAWHLFAGSITDYGWTTANTAYPHVYTMYSKNPLNITNIQVTNYDASYVAKNWVIYGSNDGTNWTQLNSGENTITTATWNITTNTSNYYNYYKIEFTNHNSGSGTYIRIGLFNLTATEKVPAAGTASDYDYYIDIDEYRAVA